MIFCAKRRKAREWWLHFNHQDDSPPDVMRHFKDCGICPPEAWIMVIDPRPVLPPKRRKKEKR